MAQIILDSNNNLIQGDFDNATLNNRTKLQTTTTNATTNVYVVPNGSSTSAGVSVANNSSLTNASKIVMATNGSTDTQIISGVNGSGTYLPLSFYTNNALGMQLDNNSALGIGVSSAGSYGRLAVNGAYAQTGTVGLTNYTIDTTPTATVVANGASVDFTLLSGMLVVNSWNSGGVTIWLMGGGGTSAVSSIIGTVGTMSYVYPYYRWTNNTGSSGTFGFFCVRTRTGP